jgi:hypothetical protein
VCVLGLRLYFVLPEDQNVHLSDPGSGQCIKKMFLLGLLKHLNVFLGICFVTYTLSELL